MKRNKATFTGQLYQLSHTRALPTGTYVAINGPWDTFGVVLSNQAIDKGEYLHQIRGVRPRPEHKPVVQF